MAASIQITKQSSLFEEVLNKNGKDCNTFYYVKNTPFLITLSSNVSLAKAKVELEVVYWEDHRPVVVPFKQLDFIVHKTKEDVKSICLEVRLHVLSSQLENAIFALLISVDGFPNKITSNAFKVVSKHDQIKRRQEKAGANPEVEVRTTPAKRKRSGGEEVIGNLDDIKENIAQQTQMLNQVLELLQQQQSSTQQKNQHTQTINKRRKINDDDNNTNNNNTSDNAKDVVYTLEIEDLKNQLMKANKRILELEVEVETLKLTNQNLQQTTQIFDKINSEMIMDMDQQASEWGHVHHHHHHADSATDEDSH